MFDYNIFKKEINSGDIWGLEYLERTLIQDLKEQNKGEINYTKNDYLINLYYAVKHLNYCNDVYEMSDKANNFKYDLYFETRDLLLKELGFDFEDLWK